MKTYIATRIRDAKGFSKGVQATVDGYSLNPRNDLVNHSPDGFEMGYAGSGPAQLALAVLSDYFADDEMAEKFHQEFKRDFIAPCNSDLLVINSEEIEAWWSNLIDTLTHEQRKLNTFLGT